MMKRIIPALDGMTFPEAFRLAKLVGDRSYALKVHDLVDQQGSWAIKQLKNCTDKVFLDYKLHDKPETVKRRAMAWKNWGVDIITIHASGHLDMMKAAVDTGMEVYAVTVLTSLESDQVFDVYNIDVESQVILLAKKAKQAGVQGIVCSPLEAGILSRIPELSGLEFVTPGIRPFGSELKGQSRSASPAYAVKNGATRLVVGSPISEATDQKKAFEDIEREVSFL